MIILVLFFPREYEKVIIPFNIGNFFSQTSFADKFIYSKSGRKVNYTHPLLKFDFVTDKT